MTTFRSREDLRQYLRQFPEYHLAHLIVDGEVSGPDQRGPCCGLYALQHVYNYWAHNGVPEFRNAPVVARKNKHGAGPVPGTSLRQYAKLHHLTQIGELLSAESLRQVGASTGMFEATIVRFSTQQVFEARIIENMKANCPLILGFDVQQGTGSPTQAHGDHAHWTTLIGYLRDAQGTLFVAHFHWGACRLDSAASFFRSNQQLDLMGHKPAEWVKVGVDDYRDKSKVGGPHGPTKGDFRSPASRDVTGLAGALVKLVPRHFPAADLEVIGSAQRLCERYDNSLKGFTGFFRNPSAESKSAVKQLRAMLATSLSVPSKANDLRDMLRHFGKDPQKTAAHPVWGKPAGTTFRKYIQEAFAGREYLLV